MPYVADSRPTNPHSTSTNADSPSTRSAFAKAAGTWPPRNWSAVAMHRPNVSARPPTMTASWNLRAPPEAPIAAVTSGTPSVQTRRFTLLSCVLRFSTPLVLSLSKDERVLLVVRQAHHERDCTHIRTDHTTPSAS